MGIIKDALQKQIQQNNLTQFNDTTATIIEYYLESNTASIYFLNPNGGGTLYLDNVPIASNLGGVTGAGIYPGQQCSITFVNNNVHNAIITGFVGSNYANKTNSDQGAYLVDSDILQCEKPVITPMIESWIDKDNTNNTKYNNDLYDYTDVDVVRQIHELLNVINKYKTTEQGITNLETKSTVKLNENGDIDIFVANNIGIRISVADKSISLYGTLKVDGKKIDLSKILNDIADKE